MWHSTESMYLSVQYPVADYSKTNLKHLNVNYHCLMFLNEGL